MPLWRYNKQGIYRIQRIDMTDINKTTNLIITGVGGQGNVLAARLLGIHIMASEYEVTVGDVYGLSQRGGSVASHVRWTAGESLPPLIPYHSLDVLVSFEPMEALRILSIYGCSKTKAIVNTQIIPPIGVQTGRFAYPDINKLKHQIKKLTNQLIFIDASEIAIKLGNLKVLNFIMLGALFQSGFIEIDCNSFHDTIQKEIDSRYNKINALAFNNGRDFVNKKKTSLL